MGVPGYVHTEYVPLYKSSTLALTNMAFAWDHISNTFGSKGYMIYNRNI